MRPYGLRMTRFVIATLSLLFAAGLVAGIVAPPPDDAIDGTAFVSSASEQRLAADAAETSRDRSGDSSLASRASSAAVPLADLIGLAGLGAAGITTIVLLRTRRRLES